MILRDVRLASLRADSPERASTPSDMPSVGPRAYLQQLR